MGVTFDLPLCLAGVLVDPNLVIRLRKCGDAMPFAPPTALLALNVEFGVVQERVGEPRKREKRALIGTYVRRNLCLRN